MSRGYKMLDKGGDSLCLSIKEGHGVALYQRGLRERR